MLQAVSNFFYDPWVFWGAPLAAVALGEGAWRLWTRLRAARRRGPREEE